MSRPDGWDWSISDYTDSHTGQTLYRVSVHDCRQPAACNLSGFATINEAELAALDWIQRRIGVPETVPQPVLADRGGYFSHRWRVDHVLDRLAELEKWFPAPAQTEYTSDAEHTAAADCWQYRCGLIGALRKSLQAERDLIQEKLWQNK